MNCWLLRASHETDSQKDVDTNFIGGQPILAPDVSLPICVLCQHPQTFFFQVEFPPEHPWIGLSLAVFACTSCANEDHLIPQLLDQELAGADIPAGFMHRYLNNFKFLVANAATSVRRNDYIEKVQFRRWSLEPTNDPHASGFKIGGMPRWKLGNETPATYDRVFPMAFLLQTDENFQFETLAGAPAQMVIDYYGAKGAYKPANRNDYELFIGNRLYLFGATGDTEPIVYAIVQSE